MAIGGSTTGTGVESDDKWGYVTSGTGADRWDGGGDANNDRGSNRQRCVVVMSVGDSCNWGGMCSVLSRGRLQLSRVGIGGGGN